MRSHVKMVKGAERKGGDYAITMNYQDETNWCPSTDCREDDFLCPMPENKSFTQSQGDYRSAHLTLENFAGEDLNHARFNCADLSCANFCKANLFHADFSNADLCQADFSYADLRGAKLNGADLSFADLRYCDLRGAELSEVRFVEVDVKGARFDRKTVMPITRDEAESRGMIYCF